MEALEILDSLEDDPPTISPASKRSPSTPSPSLSNPSSSSSAKSTLAPTSLNALAELPAVEIIRFINSDSPKSLAISRVTKGEELAMDQFVESLEGLSVHLQKQALGEKLFKEIKSFGIKGAVS